MISQRASASRPRQYKASVGPRKRQRRRQRPEREHWEDEHEAPVPAKIPASPAPRAVAPYSPRSEIEDSHLRALIFHFVTYVTVETLVSVGPRQAWWPMAVRDEAFFHSVLASTSSHAAYLQRVNLPVTFFFHRGQAIRLLNERLASGVHDEGTINTVSMFTQQEGFEGRPDRTKTHMNGLVHLVEAAGGLDSTEFQPATRRHIVFTCLAAAITLNTEISYNSNLLEPLESYFGPPSTTTAETSRTFEARLFNFTNSPLSTCAANVLWGLRNLTTLIGAFHDGTQAPDTVDPFDTQFTDRVEVLERLVHQLWYVKDAEQEQHAIFRTFGWTCCIYIYCKLRELPPELGMNTMLASRIKACLESTGDLNVLLATFQDLFLWITFMCGRVADPRDRPFFAQQATKILIIRKVNNKADIVHAAESFLWPEKEMELPASATVVEEVTDTVMSDDG